MAFGDFFRPKYKHSNETTRLHAIDSLEDDAVSIFKDLALNDLSTKVRAKAIDKISDPKELLFIGHRQDERGLKTLALERAEKLWISEIDNKDASESEALEKLSGLSDKQTLSKLAAQAKRSSVRKSALSRVDDEKMLGMVVRWAKKGESWRPALSKISNQDVLKGIAIDDHRKDVAVAAVDKLDNESFLEAVIQSAKNKGAVSRAKKRIKEFQETVRMARGTEVSVEQMVHAERAQIVRELEAFSMGNEWNLSEGIVTVHVDRWETLRSKSGLDAEFEKRFSKAKDLYFANRQRYVKKPALAVMTPETSDEPTPPIQSGDVILNGIESFLDAAPKTHVEATTDLSTEPVLNLLSDQDDAESASEQRREPLEQVIKDLNLLGEGTKLKGFERRLKKLKERKAKSQKPTSKETVVEFEEALQKAKIKLAELREADDWKRWANATAMEQMVLKAKTLKENAAEIGNLSEVLKTIQADWKKIGPAPRAKSEECWRQFKLECDAVYDIVKGQRLKRNEEMTGNLEQKNVLCDEAEALSKSEVSEDADNAFKSLQAKWKDIGPVPRRQSDQIWKRFKGACDSYFERRKPLLEQRHNEMSEALEEKENIVSELEALVQDPSIDNQSLLEKTKMLQRDFRSTGRVPAKHFKELSARLQVAGDRAFGREKEEAAAKASAEKELTKSMKKRIDDIRDSMWDESTTTVGEHVLALFKELSSGEKPLIKDSTLEKPFASLLEDAIEQFPAQFVDSHLDPVKALRQKEKLLDKLEGLFMAATNEISSDEISVAEKLKNAMANNSLGGVLGHKEQLAHGFQSFQSSWEKIGPVSATDRVEIRTRYKETTSKVSSLLEDQ